ncbi:hypothetical protein FTO74_14395 [Granulicella sp. WH15]|uniref:DUF7210 family protein n=1 Tax=Granulicella sp. WH15 TaxID=2602070 RepID=UPI001366990C|nr:hypothetical protein [Granulicella sp. WH15]QHN04422.1 hypothetical protein FTO74_14395 [Granulicella sp. WH15]
MDVVTPITTNYVTTSPIRHNRKLYQTGKPIALTTEEADRLRKYGSIREADAPVAIQAVVLGESTLAKLTVAELVEQGTLLGLTLDASSGKDAILAAVIAAAKAVKG